MICRCGDMLPHFCAYTAPGSGYDLPDPGGPDVIVPHSWLIDAGGRDQ